ncbi:hypothetical protein [Oryzihumus leptocrescens]|nr:hypothetical protein [Oryzihumus leptocrescens]
MVLVGAAAVTAASMGYAVSPAFAAATAASATTTKVVPQWSDPIDDGGQGAHAQARFRIVSVNGKCFVQTLSLAGGGGVSLTPTDCP